MLSAELDGYIRFARGGYNDRQNSFDEDDEYDENSLITSLGSDSNATHDPDPDPHAVSNMEARFYYAGLHSRPTLLYRTGKEKWSPPRGPWAYHRLKELCEVFTHPIVQVWNHDLGWKVVNVMDAHSVS
jgi:hypothetical protein